MNEFLHPVAMKVTEEQSKILVPKLIELGYHLYNDGNSPFSKCNSSVYNDYLCTNANGKHNELIFLSANSSRVSSNFLIPEYNEALFLALAARRDSEEFFVGEWVKHINATFAGVRTGELGKVTLVNSYKGITNTLEVNNNHGCYVPFWVKATLQEIVAHFAKQATPIEPEYTLPTKWWVRRNTENYKILNKWNNDTYSDRFAYAQSDAAIFSDKGYSHMGNEMIKGYREITFEQFKKYVLKESVKTLRETKKIKLPCGLSAVISEKGIMIDEILFSHEDINILHSNSQSYVS